MQIKTWFFYLWFLKCVLAGINHINRDFFNEYGSRDKISHTMINIISNCNWKNQNIVLSGNWSNRDFQNIIKISGSPILTRIIGSTEDLHYKKHKRLKNVYRMDTRVIRKKKYASSHFVIIMNSLENLRLSFSMLKNSVLWNHEGYFLIVDENLQNGCKNARSYLSLVFRSFHVLPATLLCHDIENGLQLYSFNPYTNSAPKQWNIIYNSENNSVNHFWLYHRKLESPYTDSYLKLCKDLQFDKTKNLGGHIVEIGAYMHHHPIPYNKKGSNVTEFNGVDSETSIALWSSLNVTAKINFYYKSGLVDESGSLKNFFRDLLINKIEIAMNTNLLRDFWKLQSYPHDSVGYCMVTRKEPVLTVVNFHFVFGTNGLAFIFIICLILLVFLKCFMEQSLTSVFITLVRIIVNLPIYLRPTSLFTVKEIILYSFLSFMFLGIYFQCRLVSFNIIPNSQRTLDTIEDLERSDLTIYSNLNYDELFIDLNIKNRFRFGQYVECVNRLLKGRRLICIARCNEVRFHTYNGDILHVSKEFRRFFTSFSTMEDWPLYTRFNELLRRLIEAGFIRLFNRRESYRFFKNVNGTTKFRKVSHQSLKTVWYLWAFGLTIASFTFLSEIFIYLILKNRS